MTDHPLNEDQQLLMLYEIPGTLTEDQASGRACVWCHTPYGPLIDLGGVADWRPHGCASCRTARLDCLRTYAVWLHHVDQCARCPTAPCAEGQELGQRHSAARDHAGRQAHVRCTKCRERILLARTRAIPVVQEGNTAVSRRYAHAGVCPPIRGRDNRALRPM